jgi:hypothetical protein
MPGTCFSYEAEAPPRTGRRNAAEPAPSGPRRMTGGTCFSYAADVPAPASPARWSLPPASAIQLAPHWASGTAMPRCRSCPACAA